MREVYAEKVPDPWYRERLPFFQRLSKHELRGALIGGYLMDVPMITPPIYLQRLHDQFLAAGGTVEIREIESLDDLAGEAPLLVNCSGVGAREVANDAAVYPIRGQTMLLDASGIRVGYMDHERHQSYFPPRGWRADRRRQSQRRLEPAGRPGNLGRYLAALLGD